MTPKEKASQLIVSYQIKCKSLNYNEAKQCALIAVDDMIESYEFDVISDMTNQRYIDKLNYLDEVKEEIKKF
jgi:hypothetical protein